VQNMNVELVAQMFKNYQSNVLFHLEGQFDLRIFILSIHYPMLGFPTNENNNSHRQPEGARVISQRVIWTIFVQHTSMKLMYT